MITKDSSKEKIYEELLKRTNLTGDQVTNAYMYGSRVYGTFTSESDWDFIIILKATALASDQFSDNLINVNFFTFKSYEKRIHDCEISALECHFLDKKFVLKESHRPAFKLNKMLLRKSISAKSSNSWVKANKKLTVEKDYSDKVGKKSLWHSIRIVDFGIQIAKDGKISDYASCNYFYNEVIRCYDWTELYEKYKQIYNNILTEFRKYAPK